MKREADDQSKAIERKVVDLSRRCFSGRVIKMVGMGIFSHFSLLGSNLWAQGAQSGDDCPGGGDADDLCIPPTDEDECPGGLDEVDVCPSPGSSSLDNCPGELDDADLCEHPGLRKNDICETGNFEADTCSPEITYADQCESGISPDDICPPGGNFQLDYCPGGGNDVDECPENGGIDVDECPGGSIEVDTCQIDKVGDECSPEISSEGDDCKEEHPDACFIDADSGKTDDVCTSGTNTTFGNGADDACGPALGVGPAGDMFVSTVLLSKTYAPFLLQFLAQRKKRMCAQEAAMTRIFVRPAILPLKVMTTA